MDATFTIGDHIMQQGQAFQIVSILDEETEKTVIKYKPVFEIGKFKNMICSIPLNSLAIVGIRRPLQEEMAEEILEILSGEPDMEIEVNVKTAKTFEDSNINIETAKLLSRLASEKKDPDTNFSSSKSFLLEKLISNLAQELAIIFDEDLEIAEKNIRQKLEIK